MRRLILVLCLVGVCCMPISALAADKAAISSNVDSIVAMIESGKDASGFKPDAFDPYAFIMEADGNLLVHPSLTGESLKEKALPVYTALTKASPEGTWIEYEWKGKVKHTYVKTTKSNLIVGSGY